jgi:single-strand DNA-binding protein
MTEGINEWTGLGNLTRDPELRTTSGGQPVLKFSIAINESYKDRSGARQEKTEYVNCVVWGKQAETLAKYLEKGKQVLCKGQLRTSSYDDKDGAKKYKTEVNCQRVILLGGGTRAAQPAATSQVGSNFDESQYDVDAPVDDDQKFPF